jgi:hypothetical protein
MMNKSLGAALALVLGVGVGGASAYGVGLIFPQNATENQTEFVKTDVMMAPLVFPDGRLSGYVSFEVQLEVPRGEEATIKAKLPLLMNAVNMRTYRAPLASGKDGLIPDLEAFRKIVMDAAGETYGAGFVRRAVVTQASPV